MSTSATPTGRGATTHVALVVLTVLALAVHLWGLYRVTGPPTPPWFPNADKLEHLVGFRAPTALVLGVLWSDARRRGRALSRRAVVIVVAAFAAHAVLSEVIQGTFYTTRSGDWTDAVADGIGVGLGWLVFRAVTRRADHSRTAAEVRSGRGGSR